MFNKKTLFAALSCLSFFSQADVGVTESSNIELQNGQTKIYYFLTSPVHPFQHTTYHRWGSNGSYCTIQGGSYNTRLPKSGTQRFNVAFGRQMWTLTCYGAYGDQARRINWTNHMGRAQASNGIEALENIAPVSINDLINEYNVDFNELNLEHGYFDVEVADLDSNSFNDITIVDKYSKKIYIYMADEDGVLNLSYAQDSVPSFEKIESINLYNGKVVDVSVNTK
ncbi:hypothetical protein [Pseudoalteromonas luteoviolacea]|uniref:Uncharacterized protein n=1 Tax=Pseudoalteromonas luteoviolacea H33 TaxID=1365251 RepID=A0A166ZNH2_9GAMM|nr:hypothetical protein [Pseudoalteromonas luteoviolacea]KZN44497.1 hypothetical protein N476_05735 [Pseudoalteromonas luteoviolacea H33]KZN78514.1 hypothetical protein N477_08925 [Pseudoalteromonas luteoviolacea H33-S]MBQ4878014.1 hypothetical protein [Pseudoalteromonas luteoviolacea]MBQ4907132.1 hypothetical protein [Pseudoalteromonas luteoviolacea]